MLNKCIFIGNLGADPEIRTFQNGDKVANFRIAVSETWKDKSNGEKREHTEWISVAVFGGLVKVCESYLSKGSKVYVEGQMKTRKWQDQSGNDHYSTEIVLQGFGSKLIMLGGGRDGAAPQDSGYPAPNVQMSDDEIPF